MTRKIFFSFHYERDAWRAGQVRNSNLLLRDNVQGFVDAVAWEEIRRKGDIAIQNWIKKQLEGTTVTVALIGAETSDRPWVDYEIRESWKRGNAIIGLYIHNVKDQESKTDTQGDNPLDNVVLVNGQALSTICGTYDWVTDGGRDNLGAWADEAVRMREKYQGELELKSSSITASSASKTTPATGPTVISNPSKPWAQ